MSLYGSLGENPSNAGSRRGEMVDRGVVTVTAGVATVTVPAPMRVMTHFQLTLDDNGTAIAAAGPAMVTGSLNASGTTLTITVYILTEGTPNTMATSVGDSTTKVRYAIWGTL